MRTLRFFRPVLFSFGGSSLVLGLLLWATMHNGWHLVQAVAGGAALAAGIVATVAHPKGEERS